MSTSTNNSERLMKDLVLVGTIYINDGWYGDKHRIILSESEGIGFNRKGDARKFASKLKKYIKRTFEHKKFVDENWAKGMTVDCVERDTLESYTYISAGPSISYTHHDLSVEKLLTSEAE